MQYIPNHLTVQWHITDRCNLRCKHCYQTDFNERGFDIAILQGIATHIFDWHALLEKMSPDGQKVPLYFNVTGGESLSHPDLKALLHFLAQHPSQPRLGILSNGSLIDTQWAKTFGELGVKFVQLSVEGCEATHDAIRGRGHFSEVVRASQCLKEFGVRVIWSFTAHKDNYQEFGVVAELASQYGISRVWSDRMIPTCREDAPLALDAVQTTDYLQCMHKAHKTIQKPGRHSTQVALFRALQFQAGGGAPYNCAAGSELLTIMPNGDLLPCRRLPIHIGNVLETPISKLYEHDLLQRLRNFEAPESCEPCLYKWSCKGGLRCLAHAVNGDMFSQDPGCTALACH